MNAFGSVAKILSWFFNPERWKARKEEKKIKDVKKWEDVLAKALVKNDTRMISVARFTLKQLREKYKING